MRENTDQKNSVFGHFSRSNLYGVQNLIHLIWAEGNELSSLVSEISNMFILVSMIKDNASNLFITELIFKRPTIFFTGLWIFLSLSPILSLTISFVQYYQMSLE